MSRPLKRLSLSEFALRTIARPGTGDWLVLVAPEEAVGDVASRVRGDVEALGDCSVEYIKDPVDALELVQSVRNAEREKLLVVSGIDKFSEEEWGHVDLLRSRLRRERAVVLVLSARSTGRLARNAPHLASWIGGSIWEADVTSEFLSDSEKAGRLRSLREWARLTDDEVVRRAQDGTLPNEPEFIEWLVLLGRVDLIGN